MQQSHVAWSSFASEGQAAGQGSPWEHEPETIYTSAIIDMAAQMRVLSEMWHEHCGRPYLPIVALRLCKFNTYTFV